MLSTLENLFNLARERKNTPVEGSYTNKLLSDKSLSKAKQQWVTDFTLHKEERARHRSPRLQE